MRRNSAIRRLLQPFEGTLLHPQWFVYKSEMATLQQVAALAHGLVLDVGAGTQKVLDYLPSECQYLSLDNYQTAVEWYRTKPFIFGDAQSLPLQDNSVDTVILLDVLEHLARPEKAVAEIWRVMRPGGYFILQVPFLYPLHDEPLDFQRWTEHGLLNVVGDNNRFGQISKKALGKPLETSVLLVNLAICHTVLLWLKEKRILILLAPFLLLLIPLGNSVAWLLSSLLKRDGFMPHTYLTIWRK